MFCYQCQQTAGGTGCTEFGICGKDPKTAALQDLLIGWVKQIAQKRTAYRQKPYPTKKKRPGKSEIRSSRAVDRFLLEALYATLTNVNFDPCQIARLISKAADIFQLAEYLGSDVAIDDLERFRKDAESFEQQISQPNSPSAETSDDGIASQIDELVAQGAEFSIASRAAEAGETIVGLQELILYGARGTAAYTWHFYTAGCEAREAIRLETEGTKLRIKEIRSRNKDEREKKLALQKEVEMNEKAVGEWEEKEALLLDGLFEEVGKIDETSDPSALLASALKIGELNLIAMELLERLHQFRFGVPRPASVSTSPVPGKCILVSGHDLSDLYQLLEQTKNKEVNVYTHGEMLPAHAYPGLKKFSHLVGHFGTAWQNQQKEFDTFPGAILMTTNCIQKPRESYADYIFTTGPAYWPGVKHIEEEKNGGKDFSPVIQAAFDSSGYFDSGTGENEKLTVGYGADTVIQNQDKIKRALARGELKHFFVIAGCDGIQESRNYFTQLAEAVPGDCVILTCGCGKYRFNSIKLQPLINAIPRLWDAGQCNDTWSLIRILKFLSEETGKEINSLPVSYFLSWYEQKAVAVLLSLLSLGVRNIHIGPTAPAFLSPEVLNLLSEQFGLKVISTPENDLAPILNA
ncbi:MAG: hydroxylamine reductase [Thermoguttaceae bacterium]|nr:hydroxylamine reductase [Thermoguttaceae bacterium]